jgi:hypothetical protein
MSGFPDSAIAVVFAVIWRDDALINAVKPPLLFWISDPQHPDMQLLPIRLDLRVPDG